MHDGGQPLSGFGSARGKFFLVTSCRVMCTWSDKPLKSLTAATLQTSSGFNITIIDQGSSHKWLGCMLTTAVRKSNTHDVDHQFQTTSERFYAKTRILCDGRVAITKKYFDCSRIEKHLQKRLKNYLPVFTMRISPISGGATS